MCVLHVLKKLPPATTNGQLEPMKKMVFLQVKHPLADPDINNNVRVDIIFSANECNRIYRDKHQMGTQQHSRPGHPGRR